MLVNRWHIHSWLLFTFVIVIHDVVFCEAAVHVSGISYKLYYYWRPQERTLTPLSLVDATTGITFFPKCVHPIHEFSLLAGGVLRASRRMTVPLLMAARPVVLAISISISSSTIVYCCDCAQAVSHRWVAARLIVQY
jgi:hypothetical protein